MRLNHWENWGNGKRMGSAKENRLLFVEERHAEIYTRKESDANKTVEKAKTAGETLESTREKLEKGVMAYNEKYSEADYFTDSYKWGEGDEQKRKDYPQEQPLVANADLKKQVTELLNAKFDYEGKKYPMSMIGRFLDKRKNQYKDLTDLKSLLDKLDVDSTGRVSAETAVSGFRGNRMQERKRHIAEMEESQKKWETNPEFTETRSEFESAAEGLLASRFSKLSKTPDGKDSPQVLKENKTLFLAILGNRTENFKAGGFALGPDFQNDWEKNKERFPFIYHEWMEKKGESQQALEAAKAEMAQLEVKAGNTQWNKIPNKIDAIMAGVSSLGIKNLATDVNTQGVKSSDVCRSYDKAIRDIQGNIAKKITELKSVSPADANIAILKDISKKLDPLIDLALKSAQYNQLEEGQNDAGNGFTLESLSKPQNRQLVIELAMSQYVKAQEIVDQMYGEYGGNSKALLDPSVRRMLIMTVYREGVSQYKKTKLDANGQPIEEYVESTAKDYRWMISAMAQSPYFNALNQGRFLDAEQRDFMVLARTANLAVTRKEFLEEKTREMQVLLAKVKADPGNADPQIDKDIKQIALYIHGDPVNTPLDRSNLENVIKREVSRTISLFTFQKEVENVMKTPRASNQGLEEFKNVMKKKIADLLVKTGGVTTSFDASGLSNAALLSQFGTETESVDTAYHALNYNPASRSEQLKYMGLDLEGFYLAYTKYALKNKEVNAENWDQLLQKPEGVEKLIALLESTLADSKIDGGKQDLIRTLKTLHGKTGLEIKAGTQDAQAAAISTVLKLKEEILQRQQASDTRTQMGAELKSRLEGMTFADKATEYGRAVIDMVIGSGQSLTNRAAGVAMLMAAWALISKAYKGEGNYKWLRYGGIAVAAELVLKKVTGQGMLDRVKMTGIAGGMKGMHESVLLNKGKNLDITSDEHARALLELNKVPFKDVLEWYKNTGPDGQSKPGTKTKLPKQIIVGNIVLGMTWEEQLPEIRARKALKRTVQNFLEYVGNKNQKDHVAGLGIIEERWVKAVEQKDFNLDKAEKSEISLPHQMVIEELRKNPRAFTWEEVIKAEITTDDLDAVNEGGFLNALAKKAQEATGKVAEGVRVDMLVPGTAFAKQYYQRLGVRYGKVIPELAEKGANFMEEKKDELVMWWETNQEAVRIRRAGGDMWQIVKTGAELPWLATIHTAEWSASNLKDLTNHLNERRKEWLDNERKVTIDLLAYRKIPGRTIDLSDGGDQSPEAVKAREALRKIQTVDGYDLFGRFENDFVNVGKKNSMALGMLASPNLLESPGNENARMAMHYEEGYINFIGIGPKGKPAEAYKEGIRNLVRFLRQPVNRNVIDTSSEAGKKLGEAINGNNDALINEAVEHYVDRLGSLETDANGHLVFLHFPFPTTSQSNTWIEEYPIYNTANKTARRATREKNVKYRGRYEAMAQGKELPRFETYKHAFRISAMEDPVAMGYVENPRPKAGPGNPRGWPRGTTIEKYMREFHLWNGAEADDVVKKSMQLLDGEYIPYGRTEEIDVAVLKHVLGKKEKLMEDYMAERKYESVYKKLNDLKFSSPAAAERFREIHTNLHDYFVAPELMARAGQAKDLLVQEGDSFELKYRSYLMDKLSTKFREKEGAYKITEADVRSVSKDFVRENEGLIETNIRRLIGATGGLVQLSNWVFSRTSIPGVSPPKKIP